MTDSYMFSGGAELLGINRLLPKIHSKSGKSGCSIYATVKRELINGRRVLS